MCAYVMRFIVPCKGTLIVTWLFRMTITSMVISACRHLYSYLTACSIINSLLLQLKQKMESHSSLDESQFVPVKEDYFSV